MPRNADIDGLVRYLVTSIVEDADAVSIDREDVDGVMTFRVTVAPDDIGKVIGRQGRIIKSIRTIARAAGGVEGAEVDVEVLG